MQLDFSQDLKVKITMFDYIKQRLGDLPIDMDGESATPNGNHLFTVDEQESQLDEKNTMFFHHNMAKILFLCKQAGLDVQTAVAF